MVPASCPGSSSGHPDQVPKLHQLSPFNVEKQQLESEVPVDCRDPHSVKPGPEIFCLSFASASEMKELV